MNKLRRDNLKGDIERHLREMIFSGRLPPGQKVDQERLADDLGVSKLPVREALIGLEKEGLIENVPRRGAFVASLTPDDIRDHYQIYGLVSGLAAERAASTLGAEELKRLGAIQREMELGAQRDKPDPQLLESLNDEFHRIINRAGGSRRLSAVIRSLAGSIPPGFFEFTTGWIDIAHVDHMGILNALETGDGKAAATAVADHLARSGDRAVMLLHARGFWPDGVGATQAVQEP